MKAIYKLNLDCGRDGSLYGIFVADKEYVDVLVNNDIEVYFGEILGKHSDISLTIDETDIELVTDDEKVIDMFEEYELSTGINPFDYPASDFDYNLGDIINDENTYVFDIVEQIIENNKISDKGQCQMYTI